MSNIKNKIKKSIKRKSVGVKSTKKCSNVLLGFRIVYAIVIILILIYLVGSLISGNYKLNF